MSIQLCAICALAFFVTGQQTTIRIPIWPRILEVTFDPTRVSATEVERWMQLSPDAENGYQVPENIELCVKDDPRYRGCGTKEYFNLHNAQLNLHKIRSRMNDLDPKHYPPGLLEVVLYLKRIQSFALWRESRKLAFVKTGDVSALESQFENINPKLSCGAMLDRIRKANNKEEAYKLARHDWANCLWDAEMKHIGPYPDGAWQSFLASHGIRVRIKYEDVD